MKKQLQSNSVYIKDLREYLELSLNAFGKPLGYSGTHITRFERGGQEPTEDMIALICKVYEVDPGYFRGELSVKDAVKKTTKAEMCRMIGGRIKAVRLERGLTQRELAQLVGLSDIHVCNIENGAFNISRKSAEKLAEVLGVGVEWLLNGDESKKDFPADKKMINWLWKHPEIREKLWNEMMENLE